MAKHRAALEALRANWPDVVETVHALYTSLKASQTETQSAPGLIGLSNTKGRLLDELTMLKGSALAKGDVQYDSAEVAGPSAETKHWVVTISFPGLGREDFYVGEPQVKWKQAQFSA